MTEETHGNEEGFELGQHYRFNPPVETNCIFVGGSEWSQKSFAEGWCISRGEHRAFVFQGKPVGEKGECYFLVEWGKGSVAKNIPPPPPRLQVAK